VPYGLGQRAGARSGLIAEPEDGGDGRGLSAGLVLAHDPGGGRVDESLRPVELDHSLGQRADRDAVLGCIFLDAVDQREQERWLVGGGAR
jgi:hypothetical protein